MGHAANKAKRGETVKTPVEQETERILEIANKLFFDPTNMLVAIVRALDPNYFWVKDNERIALVEADRDKVIRLYKFAAAYVVSDVMKQVICASCLVFLRNNSSEADIKNLMEQAGYDPKSFNTFSDLEEN